MMVKLRLYALLITATLFLCGSAALSADTTSWEWSLTDWDCSKNTIHPGVPILITEWEWSESWPVTSDDSPDYVYELYGPAPDPNDPDVLQTVRNRTQTPWTDWHVSITNGTYVAGSAVVYNNMASTPQWIIEPFQDGSGFFAHVESGMDTQVDYYETIHVFFSYNIVDPLQQVSIQEYPTDYYPIPEPASVMGLLAGCLAFGFRMRRKA